MVTREPLPPSRCSVQVSEDEIHLSTSEAEAEEIHLEPQRRAVEALMRGLAERAPGFNVTVIGRRGCGRTSTAVALARQEARRRPSARDLVLLPNQRWPLEPMPAFVPTGTGPALIRTFEELYARLESVVHEVLEGKTRNRLQLEIHREQSAGERALHEQLSTIAREHGLALIASDDGFDFVPIDDADEEEPRAGDTVGAREPEGDAEAEVEREPEGEGDPESESDVDAESESESDPEPDPESTEPDPAEPTTASAPDEEAPKAAPEEEGRPARRFVAALDLLRPHVEEVQRQLALLEADCASRMIQRQRDALRRELAECFAAIPAEALPCEPVRTFARQLHDYLIHIFQLESRLAVPSPNVQIPRGLVIPTLLTTAEEGSPAPLIQAQNVSLAGLFGRTVASANESRYPEPGTILAGDIHRANGGFLIIDADALVKRERVYEHLKSCLLARAIQPPEESDEGNALRVQPIGLDVKVVLVADPDLIAQLQELDPDLGRLFKIRADFAEDMERVEALRVYPGVASWLARHRGLPRCSRAALRELVIFGARVAEDQRRMTTNVGILSDLIAEAAATAEPGQELDASHFHRARAILRERYGLMREKLIELYRSGALRVELQGAHVGQVNGLAVVSDGFQALGRPCRVTAVTYAGTQGTLNIDREVEMSGPIHAKGILILSGYLYDRFARSQPIVFGASVVFEQTYLPIEGDSASTAELFAILSSLAQVPARQDIGVTGSVDQRGRILPVGALNEKIEGFYDLCEAAGLTGTQGVIIPHTNVHNLVLRADVIEAIAARRFFIWPIATVEEGVEILMGTPAGHELVADDAEVDHLERGDEHDAPARFPDDTVYGKIERRLSHLRRAQHARPLAR
ncbi:MAG: AAA family ATPase [Nannocystaceae bacterium]